MELKNKLVDLVSNEELKKFLEYYSYIKKLNLHKCDRYRESWLLASCLMRIARSRVPPGYRCCGTYANNLRDSIQRVIKKQFTADEIKNILNLFDEFEGKPALLSKDVIKSSLGEELFIKYFSLTPRLIAKKKYFNGIL